MRERSRESRNRFGKGGFHNFIHSGRRCSSKIFLKDLPQRTSHMPSVELLLSSNSHLSDGFVYHRFLILWLLKVSYIYMHFVL